MARPKHRTQPGATYFVTTDTWQRRSLFLNAEIAAIVEESLFCYRDAGHYLVHRHVLMPDHLHLIVTPGDSTSLERAMQLIKGGSSYEIGRRRGMRFPMWHQGFTEHRIRDQRDFDIHSHYIDQNPVKARIVVAPTDYPHGSAAARFRPDPWCLPSGAKAQTRGAGLTAGLKTRPSACADSAPDDTHHAEAN